MKTLTCLCGLLVASSVLGAGLTEFQVMFETMECSGETGYAAVDARRVFRIQASDCTVDGSALKQVLVRPEAGESGFEVFTVTKMEAQAVMQQLRLYRDVRLRAIEKAGTLLIEK